VESVLVSNPKTRIVGFPNQEPDTSNVVSRSLREARMHQQMIMRFLIAPAADGWSWRTFGQDGQGGDGGRAPSKRLAAAMVIQDIVRRACQSNPSAQAKAA
jgi:hypothetical protein